MNAANLLINKHFAENSFVKSDIESFNNFVEKELPAIFEENKEIIPTIIPPNVESFKIKIDKVWVTKPEITEADGSKRPVYPQEARLRQLSYAAPVFIEISSHINDVQRETFQTQIGSLPVMLKSKYCRLSPMTEDELIEKGEDVHDAGGYFIINGTERVLVSIEDLAPNKFLVEEARGISKYVGKLFSEQGPYKIPHTIERLKDGGFYLSFTRVSRVPVIAIIKALGMINDEDIVRSVSKDKQYDELLINLFEHVNLKDPEQAMDYIAKKMGITQAKEIRIERMNELLDRYLLPHVGTKEDSRRAKAISLCKYLRKYIECYRGTIEPDDKDHYMNKRVKMSGDLLADLFRMNLKVFINDMLYNFQRIVKRGKFPSIKVIIREKLLTSRIYSSMATGNWVGGRKGVSQRIQRLNYLNALSNLQRVVSPLSASQENFKARELHATHLGRLCPSETPEGTNIGLRKNLALLASVSEAMDVKEVTKQLQNLGVSEEGNAEAYVNGLYVGMVQDTKSFAETIREERAKGNLSSNINVHIDVILNQAHVECGKGRTRRPLIVVRDGMPLLTDKHIKQLQKNETTWGELVKQGVLEYVDAGEEENMLVAFGEKELTPDHTHLEISPLTMLGVVTALVPYGNYTQSARLSIGAKNQKQGIGFYAANFPVRMDMDVNLLHSPQSPIVRTVAHDLAEYDRHPAGQNVIVAVMSYKGYNIEDAIIINKGSLDRGLGRSTYFRPASAEELRYSGGLMDKVAVPDKDVKGYKSEQDYRLLEDDGVVFVEAKVKEEDVVIGKVSPPRFLSSLEEYSLASNITRESSVALKHGEEGIVDFVMVSENDEGNKIVQVRIRDQRIPEIGDKFVSRHGQKGIVGLIVPEQDMPFTANGVRPDIIFSPHSIPSRMTVSHLLESIGAKAGALAGRFVDATTFESEPEDVIRNELLTLGFAEDGTESMYDGLTGHRMQARIFIGSMYYLKLKHMVANKIHSRARGPIQLLTRQPTEGRAKEGGLRLGEMEKDTFVAHGSALLLKERFDSDKTVVPVCEECGMIAVYDAFKEKSLCPVCGDNAVIHDVEMSYAFKLILDEFKSLGVYPKLELGNRY
ncbi:MAG: DNA-directed RNA polymerase subunit B [Candidatus Woesearchaeota archaeon]|jgi:DNA-directed RNA polymerase subunit B|nr:DNA-directed RNA polymerase subunit B [Candidatus Woesearchaeota archaeon]MDP7199058.1 DNA-directed RNA polymerase subunit B [Candidatus Woesearchaeota archaeon]MDP7467768.1 DNA-directed RNA polymerase subunit B [Candidatus Woesearchaeota archaeon]MDP7646471.1 DNA-directed RNA polymerase subunit B [Candidatus Woesearchaeota archaeon]